MAKQFSIECTECRERIGFDTIDVDGLDDHINDAKSMAASDAREDERWLHDNPENVDATVLTTGDRPLWELAAAIRRGDREDAEMWLDRIASELGTDAEEQVQQGRHSFLAKP